MKFIRPHMRPNDHKRSGFIIFALWGHLGAHLGPASTISPPPYEISYAFSDVRLDPHFNAPPPNTPPPSPRRPPSHTQQRALKVPSANYKPAPATSSLIDSCKLGLLSQRLHAQRCANSCCIFILIQCTKLRLVAAFAFCISRKASTGQSKISRATAYATSKSFGSSSRLSTWRASMALLWFVIVLVLVASLSDQIKAANANQQKGQIDRR